jgi:murein DD-endopeptidase MepM/ murein hydrolase activator NlpD
MTLNLNRPKPSSRRPLTFALRSLGWVSCAGLLGGPIALAQTVNPAGVADNLGAAPVQVTPVDVVPDTMTLAPEARPSAPAADETFIDSTHYTVGATERSGDRPPGLAVPGVPVNSLTGGDGGIPRGISPGQTTASGQSYAVSPPSVQYFYNRTVRPPGRLGNGNLRLIFPLAIPAPITSVFGWRTHPISGDQRFHSGTDLGAPMGTPVLAAYAGQVAIADFMGGYGLAITLDHNQGTQQTLYGHLSEIFVKPGDPVKQGDVIGRVGSTGNSTGPHLHFEFHQLTSEGWLALDPGAQLEYSLSQFMNALQLGKPGTAIGSFNVGLAGNADLKPSPSNLAALQNGAAIANPLLPISALPTVVVSKTVYPVTLPAAQPAPVPVLSNQQLSNRPLNSQKLSDQKLSSQKLPVRSEPRPNPL